MTVPSRRLLRSSAAAMAEIRWLFVVVTFLGLLAAFGMGRLAGNGDVHSIAAVLTITVAVVICLTLKSKIWLLIPATYFLTGAPGGLSIPFGLNELTTMGVFGMFIVFAALKVPLRKVVYGRLDHLVFLNIAYLGTVYIRNPAGTRAFGSDLVGGRPYFSVVVGLMAYWVFKHIILDKKALSLFPRALVGGMFVNSVIGVVTRYIPGTATVIAPFYSGVNTQSYISENFESGDLGGEEYRLVELGGLGDVIHTYLVSFFRPLTLITPARIFHFVLFVGSWAGILSSGFRSSIIQQFCYFLMASYFYSGMRDVVRAVFLSFAAIVAIVAGQGVLFDLPAGAQRSLSFLPARWTSTEAVESAKASSEWRFILWRRVWESDKYIKNKVFGDGFGFQATDLQIQIGAMTGGPGYMGGEMAESQMVTGAFHSGPLSTIRVVGIVGLIFYTMLMIMSARHSWRLIQRARGTPFFGFAVYIGMTLIYKPFEFYVVFGSFDGSLPFSIYQVGLLTLISTALEEHLVGQVPADVTAKPIAVERSERRLILR